MKSSLRAGFILAGVFAVAACSSSTTGGAPPLTPSSAVVGTFGAFQLPSNLRRVCEVSRDPNVASCDVLLRTDIALGPNVSGLGPPDIQSAYNLPSSTKGVGQTIAVIDSFDNPNIETDLGVYRAKFGLAPCTTANGCFQKLDQNGHKHYPRGDPGWGLEEDLDVQMVSAVCPNCHIILVEGLSDTFHDLAVAVDTAIEKGADVVSNSYGSGAPVKLNAKLAAHYNHPGTIILASAGDSGYGTQAPANLPTVVSVGGTMLSKMHGGRGWNEVVWPGTGSGCEPRERKPAWQTDAGCSGRTMNDVSAVATGVAVYDTYPSGGWGQVAGTSISTPLVGSVYGLAGNANKLNAAQSLYAQGASLFDITKGSNAPPACTPPKSDAYLCKAEIGYDGPTGNGTPNGDSAF